MSVFGHFLNYILIFPEPENKKKGVKTVLREAAGRILFQPRNTLLTFRVDTHFVLLEFK